MNRITRVLCAALLLCAVAPQPAVAQLGSIIDMIQKMSGPEMRYYGVTYRWGYQPGQELDSATVVGAYDEIETSLRRSLRRLGRATRSGSQPRDLPACLDSARAVLGYRGGGFYEEGAVDRIRTDRDRLWDLISELRKQPSADEVDAPLRHARDLACAQPDILAEAERDRMGGFTWRVGLHYGIDQDNPAPSARVRSIMGQLTGEYIFAWPMVQGANVGIEGGVSAHHFFYHTDEFESFLHPTFPVRLNLHPFTRCRGWLLRNFRLGGGAQLVPPFPEGAFDGIYPQEDDWELLGHGFVAVDISAGSFSSPMFGC